MILILFGAPGVGKGTVGTLLSKDLNIPLVSTGDILRRNVKKRTELGCRAKSFMEKGALVPDGIIIKMVKEEVSHLKEGFILDGFPRTLNQAEKLEMVIGNNSYQVVNLEAKDDFLINRLSNRRICKNCGAIYHLINIPPKRKGICDRCGGSLYQREDDQEEVVKERLSLFHSEAQPIISYYGKKGSLKSVDGSLPLQKIVNLTKGKIK
ncbi:MAG: adenylate kinase [Candidatus Omnitrophica bacterium]|nr:adenylate kinase [Candidatus Omnitrophota bacterium]